MTGVVAVCIFSGALAAAFSVSALIRRRRGDAVGAMTEALIGTIYVAMAAGFGIICALISGGAS